MCMYICYIASVKGEGAVRSGKANLQGTMGEGLVVKTSKHEEGGGGKNH